MTEKAKTKKADAEATPEVDTIIDPQTGEAISSTNEPDATGSTSGIPPIGPTDMDGDGEPDAGAEEAQELRDQYADHVKSVEDEDAARREAKGLPAEGPEQKRRANSLAEALYPNENVSDEAKEASAPKADASHA